MCKITEFFLDSYSPYARFNKNVTFCVSEFCFWGVMGGVIGELKEELKG